MNRKLSLPLASLLLLLPGLGACGSDPTPELGVIFDKGVKASAPPFEELTHPTDPVPAGPFTCATTPGTDSMGETKVVELNDGNNYGFRNQLTLANNKVKAASNLSFDWGAITKSFLSHDINPKVDIGSLVIAMFPWPHDELQRLLGTDQVGDNDAMNVITIFTQEPNQSAEEPKTVEGFTSHDLLTNVNFNHVHIDQSMVDANLNAGPDGWDPSMYTWAVLLQKGSEIPAPAGAVQMIHTFTLDTAGSNTSITINNDSAILQYSTVLQQWKPVLIPTDLTGAAFRWSTLTKNGMGIEIDGALGVGKLFIGHYKETPEQLEKQFLDLLKADFALEEYTNDTQLAFAEGSARLSDFKTKDGKAFTGITTDGTWMIGINCVTCKSPAPSYLGVLRTCSGG